MAESPQTSTTFKKAEIKGAAKVDGGFIELTIRAPVDECSATLGEIADLTAGAFNGTVTIKGRAQQLSLIPDKPPKE